MTTYDRYLLRRFIHVFLVLFVTTFGLYVIIDCFTNVDGFQENRDDTWEVLSWIARYYSYQSVVFFGMVAPILSVVSVVVVLAMLVKRGELQPVLAAGVPTYRLAVPFLIGVMFVEAGVEGIERAGIDRCATWRATVRSRVFFLEISEKIVKNIFLAAQATRVSGVPVGG